MGRANRLLARRATVIATGFADIKGIPANVPGKLVHTGNPIRPAVLEAAKQPYAAPEADGTLRLLVVGGSQGARVMSDVVPPAIERLPPDLRARLVVMQQARGEDLERVREHYARNWASNSRPSPSSRTCRARMAQAHLVVSRSGASTVAELAVIGRPSILVPLPGALDQDQAANAKTLGDLGAAIVIPQVGLHPRAAGRRASQLCLREPERLTRPRPPHIAPASRMRPERLAQVVLDWPHFSNNNGKNP